MKKIKKIKLNIDTISNLTEEKMKNINGGGGFDSGNGPCTASMNCGASNYAQCGSFVATGTGYGMCCCNATGYCS